MAAVSVNLVNFPTSLIHSSQLTGRASSLNLVSVAWRHSASSRTSWFRISCSAKPATVEKVVEIVKKQLALPADKELTPGSKFAELGADSLDTVEIVMGLEEEFDITVEEDGSQNITTVQEAADLIESILEKKAKA